MRPHSSRGPCACPGRQVDAEREAPLCCSPKLTHLSTAVPQDTVPHHLRSASRRGRHCMAPQEGLQSSQRRWRATAARYRRGRGAVQGILAHTLRRPCPRTPRRDPSSLRCPTARASPLISIPSVAREENAHTHADGATRCHSTPMSYVSRARGTLLCLVIIRPYELCFPFALHFFAPLICTSSAVSEDRLSVVTTRSTGRRARATRGRRSYNVLVRRRV